MPTMPPISVDLRHSGTPGLAGRKCHLTMVSFVDRASGPTTVSLFIYIAYFDLS